MPPSPIADWNRLCSVHQTFPFFTALKSASSGLLASSSSSVCSSPVDGRVVDEHISVLRAGVKALHLHIHGRAGIIVGEVVKDILSSGELEHFCDIIGGFAHICCAVRRDIEECGGLAGGRPVKDGSEGVELLVIERLRLLFLSCEHAVQLDPLHAAEGIGFRSSSARRARGCRAVRAAL